MIAPDPLQRPTPSSPLPPLPLPPGVRSRQIEGGWHLNLFRWNTLGGPRIEIAGDPTPVELSPDGPKWGL